MTETIQQDSPEWHALKHRRIGGTAAAVIYCGGTPWVTPFELWLSLTGRAEQPWNPAMLRGKELEQQARRIYRDLTERNMQPAVVTHPTIPWMIASLDGRCGDGILEVKAPGRDAHEAIGRDGVPDYYAVQVQHYLFVTGAKWADVVSYHPDAEPPLHIFRVLPDEPFMARLMEMEHVWYQRHIVNDEPPAKTKDDTIMRDDAPFIEAARLYREEEAIIVEHQAKLEAARELLLSLTNGAMKVEGGGVKVTRYAVAGSLDWSGVVKAAKAAGVNVEAFRKEGREQVRVTVVAK